MTEGRRQEENSVPNVEQAGIPGGEVLAGA